jgi:hypothetical protein
VFFRQVKSLQDASLCLTNTKDEETEVREKNTQKIDAREGTQEAHDDKVILRSHGIIWLVVCVSVLQHHHHL